MKKLNLPNIQMGDNIVSISREDFIELYETINQLITMIEEIKDNYTGQVTGTVCTKCKSYANYERDECVSCEKDKPNYAKDGLEGMY